MMNPTKQPKKHETIIGIIAMSMLVAGTFADPGSSTQKMLFLIPGPMLAYTAYVARQKMLLSLQAVLTVGVLLSFYPQMPASINYLVLGTGLIVIGYLAETHYIKQDKYWPLAALGILLLAFGYSTNANKEPLIFNALLASGSFSVAIYSYIGYHKLKTKVSGIWLILNLLFMVNPTATVITKIFF
jgi:hypothetical protein